MKKKLLIILIIITMIIGLIFISTGFKKRSDVVLMNFKASEDGKKMKLNIVVASSIGYARSIKTHQSDNKTYVEFYSAFGLFNSKIGAKNEYEIELDPSCREIYFYKGNDKYDLVLKKDKETNKWNFVK